MARKVIETKVEQFTDAGTENAELMVIQQENNQVAVADAVIMGSFEAIEAIGIIKAAQFMATVSEKLIAETALNIRNTKSYKGLPYQDENQNRRQVATFDEFCEAFLSKSGRRVRELISNYNELGPDLYEQAEKLGFRQRDYNALKALPADDKLLIAQAIESEDLDKALDFMQQMAAKHCRDKEATTRQLAEQQQTLEAKDQVIRGKTEQLDKQTEQIALLEHRQRTATVDELTLQTRDRLQTEAAQIKAAIMTSLRKAVLDLTGQPGDHSQLAAACLIEIQHELIILRDEHNLPASVTESQTPEWLDYDAAMNAKIAEQV